MTRSIDLSPEQRTALLDRYRKDPDPEVRFRSHILLLLDDGHTWATVAAMLFCSSRTIDRWVKRFHAEGVEGRGRAQARPTLSPRRRLGRRRRRVGHHQGAARLRLPPQPLVLRGGGAPDARDSTTSRSAARPSAAGSIAATWSTAARAPWSARRTPSARPSSTPSARLLAGLPADETAVFQDEVDINTNPKIGSMWMVKGRAGQVETPGNNEKRYLSGSIHWRTGQVFVTEGKPKQGRDTALFLAHLDDLRSRLRRYRKIHVICDSAKCHTSDEVAVYLWEHRDRIELHLLPKYSPDCNPIERVWWNLHEPDHPQPRVPDDAGVAGPDVRLAGEPEPVQGRGDGLPGRGRLNHFPC